jgi:hypothetical protein
MGEHQEWKSVLKFLILKPILQAYNLISTNNTFVNVRHRKFMSYIKLIIEKGQMH